MNWYQTLDIHQRINLKDVCVLIVGVTWQQLGIIFTFEERIEILHQKLQLDGFIV